MQEHKNGTFSACRQTRLIYFHESPKDCAAPASSSLHTFSCIDTNEKKSTDYQMKFNFSVACSVLLTCQKPYCANYFSIFVVRGPEEEMLAFDSCIVYLLYLGFVIT